MTVDACGCLEPKNIRLHCQAQFQEKKLFMEKLGFKTSTQTLRNGFALCDWP